MRSQLCLGLTVVFDQADPFIILLKQVKGPTTLFSDSTLESKTKNKPELSSEDNPKTRVNP